MEIRNSNPIMGLVGAVIGSCTGVFAWVAIYYFGFIAAIAGWLIVAAAFKGYEMLGGSLDLKGIFISIVVSVVMVFVANYISWSVEVYVAFEDIGISDFTFTEVVKLLPDFIKDFELVGDFVKDLVVGYVLAIIGASSTVVNRIRNAQ